MGSDVLMECKIVEPRVSYVDDLTGAIGREAFYNYLVDALEVAEITEARPVLVMLGLDRFKHFNVHNGHSAGDAVLVQFTNTVRALLPPDAVLARTGGDELMILLPDASLEAGCALGARLVVACRGTLTPPQKADCGDPGCLGPTEVTLTVGVSRYSPPQEAHDLLFEVENRCDEGKTAGGDRVWPGAPATQRGS